jgi:S-layer family protein
MRNPRIPMIRLFLVLALMVTMIVLSTRMKADTGICSGQMISVPFTDVSASAFFCQIAAAYFSGLTNGTSATTFSPSDPVSREQMAAFTTRTLDQSLKRGSRRAALGQWWTTQGENNLGLTTVGSGTYLVQSDGADLWVANYGGTVSRVRASDGRLLETWTGATAAHAVLCAMGKVFIAGETNPGSLYQIDPSQAAGAVTTVSTSLGAFPRAIAFDGQRIWTANAGGSVSIITLNPTTVTTVTTGFAALEGIIYDGTNIWVTENFDDSIKKLNSQGTILQSVSVGLDPHHPVFDGTNIWVPNGISSTVTVVRASTGAVLATLTLPGNGLNTPIQAAFDGERILVTNFSGNSASLWKASDLTPLGTFSTGANTLPFGVCSDGVNFWITFAGTNQLARF